MTAFLLVMLVSGYPIASRSVVTLSEAECMSVGRDLTEILGSIPTVVPRTVSFRCDPIPFDPK